MNVFDRNPSQQNLPSLEQNRRMAEKGTAVLQKSALEDVAEKTASSDTTTAPINLLMAQITSLATSVAEYMRKQEVRQPGGSHSESTEWEVPPKLGGKCSRYGSPTARGSGPLIPEGMCF